MSISTVKGLAYHFLHYEVEVFAGRWRYFYTVPKNISHQFWTKFEHEFAHGGGSGYSGGIFAIA